MIEHRHLATIRAALRFWNDEFSPHGIAAGRIYFQDSDPAPLKSGEISMLIAELDACEIGYIAVTPELKMVLKNREANLSQAGQAVILFRL